MYCNNNSTERQFGYGKMEKMLGVIDKNGYEKVNRVYSIQGEPPTITARDYKDPIKIIDMSTRENTIVQSRAEQSRAEQSRAEQSRAEQVIVIGRMDNTVDHTYESANRVYSSWGICPTIPTCAGGNIQPKVLVKI